MMAKCWAAKCKHYSQRETCKFFRFPKEKKKKSRWKRLLMKNAEPGPGAYVCSCHFRDGKKENGPEIFQHNIGKRFNFPDIKRKPAVKRPKISESSNISSDSTMECLIESDM
ncbi:hypothetical protein ABEB36_014525 [Hypothenemus hampei]